MVQGSHILAFTDSSSALVCIHKASFDPVNAESQNTAAGWIGWTLVSNETYLYSQHIKGTESIITYYLSHNFRRLDQTLTKHFNQILPPHTSASLHIKQLPRNVISWISMLSAASTLPMALQKPLIPSSLATDIGGAHSLNIQELQTNYWGGMPQEQRKMMTQGFSSALVASPPVIRLQFLNV